MDVNINHELDGHALLRDMVAYRQRITSNPDMARGFLTRLGVVTPDGDLKTLTRGSSLVALSALADIHTGISRKHQRDD